MSRIKQLKSSLTQFPDIDPPPLWLLALEYRAIWEVCAGMLGFKPLQHMAPAGDGHPILVLPGLGASDQSTVLLRSFLDGLGYITYPWSLGRNKGLSEESSEQMKQRLKFIFDKHGQKVSIVGHSLGGVFARELAKYGSSMVRQVITLGSPFTGHPLASTGTHFYEWISGDRLENIDYNQHLAVRIKPPVPTTSIYSKLDGVVAWECSIEEDQPEGENINVRGNSHIGLGSSPAALYLIAERLAQDEGNWKPFEPTGIGQVLYGVKDHLNK